MNQTAKFELELKSMGVDIIEFRYQNDQVSEVFGKINGTTYKWNSFGHCFLYGNPAALFNLNFFDSIQISDDQKTILHQGKTHKFRRAFFMFSNLCAKCSLNNSCMKCTETDFPFPCVKENRKDKHHGFFVRKNIIINQ